MNHRLAYSPKHVSDELALRRAFDDLQSAAGRYSARTSSRFRKLVLGHPAYPLVLCETPFFVIEQLLFLCSQYTHNDLKHRLITPKDSVIRLIDYMAAKFASRDVHPDAAKRFMSTANQVITKVMIGQTSFLAVYVGPSYSSKAVAASGGITLQHKDQRVFSWTSAVEPMTRFPPMLQTTIIPLPVCLGKLDAKNLGKAIADKIRTPEFGESVVRHFSKFRQEMIDGQCAPESADGLVRVFFVDHLPVMFVTLHVVPKKVQVRKKGNAGQSSLVHYEVRIRRDSSSTENIFCACPCIAAVHGGGDKRAVGAGTSGAGIPAPAAAAAPPVTRT